MSPATTQLRIAAGLELPVDVVTQPIAILARRGAGKTYTASVIVEEVIRAKVPVVVLDPTGAWWGLRSSADGKAAGLPVVIFGGDHGDVPLDEADGAAIADVVLEHPGAYVVDLSGFPSKRSEQRFAADFLERLYRAKKRESGALLVVVDEADFFAPQQPRDKGDQLRTLGALESIVRRGRIKGLGDLLITQRAAVLNKNVLTQTEVLVVMQTTGPQDRAAIDEWIEGNGTREERAEVLESLASLERGEAWIWSPAFLRILRRIRIRERSTFDSSRTPAAGEARIAPTAFAVVDLEQLGERIRATREKAKADDPAELRKRIRALERQANANVITTPPAPEVRIERVEVPVLNGEIEDLREILGAFERVGATIEAAGGQLRTTGNDILAALDRVAAAPRPAPVIPAVRRDSGREPDQGRTGAPPAQRVEPVSRPAVAVSPRPPAESGSIKAGARRMLSALAALHPTPLTRQQLGTLAEVTLGGTFSSYLSTLRVAGLVDDAGGTIALTGAGTNEVAGELGRGAPTTAELVALYGSKLKAGARRMLEALVDVHPDGFSRGELAERTDVTLGGTFSSYLSSLRTNGLIDESGGQIFAGPTLYLGAR